MQDITIITNPRSDIVVKLKKEESSTQQVMLTGAILPVYFLDINIEKKVNKTLVGAYNFLIRCNNKALTDSLARMILIHSETTDYKETITCKGQESWNDVAKFLDGIAALSVTSVATGK